MQQSQTAVQHVGQRRARPPRLARSARIEADLGGLDVPIEELGPQEVVQAAPGFAELIALHQAHHVRVQRGKLRRDPFVDDGWRGRVLGIGRAPHGADHKLRAVPEFVGEVRRGLDAIEIDAQIGAFGGGRDHHEAEGIGAVRLDDLRRIVAGLIVRFLDLRAIGVPHHAVEIDGVERQPVGELQTKHDHARHPEKDDVDAGFQDVGGIEPLEVGRLVRPAERGKRPEPRAEPGIEDVRVLVEIISTARRAALWIGARHQRFAAGAAVPHRDAVPQPELTRDAPGLNDLHPAQKLVGGPTRIEGERAVVDGLGRLVGHWLGIDEPLLRHARLDDRAVPLAVAEGMRMGLDALEQALALEKLDVSASRLEAVHPGPAARCIVQRAVVAEDADDREPVPLSHAPVVRVVAGVIFTAPLPNSWSTSGSAMTGISRPIPGTTAVRPTKLR